ncbi:hypothetical protein I0292_26620 (plasmid) [Priestia megaterium]|uniref:hypothetical protein n=1 Tax=Priestia megaterium TaxID=1404 RepID=UPI00206C035A|nr:hypothetical protein [Priestia megaterium]UOO43823.1 hypothetical protein I0292_26620 [Priestia megaterium]
MKKFIAFLFALGLVIPSGIASAESTQKDKVDYDKIAEHMKEDGASQDDIDKVIKKLKNGEELDADKSENQKVLTLSKTQLHSALTEEDKDSEGGEDDSISTTDAEPTKKFTFNDGSYVKLSIESDDTNSVKSLGGDMSTMSTTGKTIKVKGSSVWGGASYKAKIYLSDSPVGNDYISSVYSPTINTYFGTYSNPDLKISRKYEVRSKNITAKSYLFFKYTNQNNFSSKTKYLRMHVGDKINDKYGIYVSYTDGSASYQ